MWWWRSWRRWCAWWWRRHRTGRGPRRPKGGGVTTGDRRRRGQREGPRAGGWQPHNLQEQGLAPRLRWGHLQSLCELPGWLQGHRRGLRPEHPRQRRGQLRELLADPGQPPRLRTLGLAYPQAPLSICPNFLDPRTCELRRINLLGRTLNKGRRAAGFGDVWGGFEEYREHRWALCCSRCSRRISAVGAGRGAARRAPPGRGRSRTRRRWRGARA